MPAITDWLMVGITAVYVAATISISRANIKSANATREQLAESKRQYEDRKRLEIMPYIQFERTKATSDHELNLVLDSGNNLSGNYTLLLRMKNIGNGTAKDIMHTYQWDNLQKSSDHGLFPVQALSSGESQTIKVVFAHSKDETDERNACFILRYRDLLNHAYTQALSLKFKRQSDLSLKLIGFTTSSPVFVPNEEAHT